MPENNPERKEREIDLDEELVSEAFELKADDRLQLEKKILCVAFLLEACSEHHGGDIDGATAEGLAQILRPASSNAAPLLRPLPPPDIDLQTPLTSQNTH